VTVTALDAFGNPATSAAWWKTKGLDSKGLAVVLDEEAIPKEDATLSTDTITGEPTRKLPRTVSKEYSHSVRLMPKGRLLNEVKLVLKMGSGSAKVRATIAGELSLTAAQPGAPQNGVAIAKGARTVDVKAAPAEMFDLVPLDQGAFGMRVMVHARDPYGNLDEECEREVVIEPSGEGEERVGLPDGGLVRLVGGVAELTGLVRGGARPS